MAYTTTTCNGCGKLVPFLGSGSECPCTCHRTLPPQPLTGSTMAQDNDPAFVPVSTRASTAQSKAAALRQVAEVIAKDHVAEALLLLEMADDLDPAKQGTF